jgi:RimJ/RimL family protein N-acetyltransferase
MSRIYLETERFCIRSWELDDAEELYKIMSDSRVHTYTGDKPWSLKRATEYIKLIINYDFKTLEAFHAACVLKAENVIIGLTGLNPYLPKQPEIEWQFGVPFWGKGYATEIGKAVIKRAFETTDIECIYGMVNPQNNASMKVMEKIGMTCLGLREFRGEMDMFYQFIRPEPRPGLGASKH